MLLEKMVFSESRDSHLIMTVGERVCWEMAKHKQTQGSRKVQAHKGG